ncbi:MAG: hypothetical protein ABIM62_06060 [candidate division WOR-3 bacterium]
MFGLNFLEEFLYIKLSNYFLIGGIFLLWIGFLLFGNIARKFEIVLRIPTRWFFIMIAPTGIFVYGIIALYASLFKQMVKMNPNQSFIAYSFFLFSGILTFLGILQFFNVVKRGGR